MARFQNDESIKAFVMTLKMAAEFNAGGYGLYSGSLVEHFGGKSGVDRSHRMGQKNTVFTYRLIAKNTIEEKILELQKHKKELVDQVISTDENAMKKLTEADIDHLLGA